MTQQPEPTVKADILIVDDTIANLKLLSDLLTRHHHKVRSVTGGAMARKIGRFELAGDSSLFLDEIGEMALDMPTKLPRVLQEGEFERVGGTSTIKVNVRIITVTQHDLAERVREGQFREDLFYRLNVFPIALPPLRERSEDLLDLVQYFVKHYADKFGKNVQIIPEKVLTALQKYHWPGNIRELQNLIERGNTQQRTGISFWRLILTQRHGERR